MIPTRIVRLLTVVYLISFGSHLQAQPAVKRIDLHPFMSEIRHDLAERYPKTKPYPATGVQHKTKNVHIAADSIRVGDKRSFWSLVIDAQQRRPDSQRLVHATCAAIGEHCYVFIEDDNPHIPQYDQEFYAIGVINLFEKTTAGDPDRGIYQLNEEAFGTPPDEIDGDPRIYILIEDIHDHSRPEKGIVAGYFYPVDQYENFEHNGAVLTGLGWFYSNQVEMITLDSFLITRGDYADVLAHEFQHLIHWGLDQDEEVWLDEAFSMHAMYNAGYIDPTAYFAGDDNSTNPGQIMGFFDDPGLALTGWEFSFADYGKVLSWMAYFTERYGGNAFVRACIQSPRNGLESMNEALQTLGYADRVEDIFQDWVIANYADLPDEQYDGRYSLYQFNMADYDVAGSYGGDVRDGVDPILPDTLTVASQTIAPFAAKFFRFTPQPNEPLKLAIAANPMDFKAWVLEEDQTDGHVLEVLTEIPAENLRNGTYMIETPLSDRFYTVALANTGSDAAEAKPFYAGSIQTEANEVIVAPNPFHPRERSVTFRYTLNQPQTVRITIYDLAGDLVCKVLDEQRPAGADQILWDGRNNAGNVVSAGVYLYTFQAGSMVQRGKLGILR